MPFPKSLPLFLMSSSSKSRILLSSSDNVRNKYGTKSACNSSRHLLLLMLLMLTGMNIQAQQVAKDQMAKEPDAIAILELAATAAGTAKVSDVTVSGSLIEPDTQKRSRLTIAYLGKDKSKLEIKGDQISRMRIRNGAKFRHWESGIAQKFPLHANFNSHSEFIPYLSEILDWNEDEYRATY